MNSNDDFDRRGDISQYNFDLRFFKDDRILDKKSTYYILLSAVFAIGYLLYAKYYLFIYKYPMISEEGYRIGIFIYPYLGLVLLNTVLLFNSLRIELSIKKDLGNILPSVIAFLLLPYLYVESIVMSLWVFYQNAFEEFCH